MRKTTLLMLTLILLGASAFAFERKAEHPDATRVDKILPRKDIGGDVNILTGAESSSRDYHGYLRVYVVEPVSRWLDKQYHYYENGFLAFAINQTISIPFHDSYETTVVWDGSAAGFGDITQDNIMVIAVVSSTNVGHTAYSDPPSGAPFTAYYADAAAAALPGETGLDVAAGDFTHTVFIEEATGNY